MLLIITPTYNEKSNVIELAEKLSQLKDINWLVVDDNSPDGTGETLKELKQKYNWIHVIHRSGKMGLGTAYFDGFQFAVKNNYDFVTTMDADLSHKPEYIPELLKKLNYYDIVVGSRYAKNGSSKNCPFYRKLLSKAANFYIHIVTGLNLKDCTSGFMAMKIDVIKNIDFNKFFSKGYCMLVEFKYRAVKKDYNICEIPIIFYERTAGESKMTKDVILESFLLMLKLKFLH